MSTTLIDIVTDALETLGVIAVSETPSSSQLDSALRSLNALLGEWDNNNLITLSSEQIFTLSSGVGSYTIGDGETFDGQKPLSIKTAFCRLSPSTIDYPLVHVSEIDYAKISLKSLSGIPEYYYYNADNEFGTIYIYPTPNAAFQIHIFNETDLTEYTTGSDVINLPKGYISALKWQLCIDLSPKFQIELNPLILKRAAESLEAIKNTNQDVIPLLNMPKITDSCYRSFLWQTGRIL
jgi:hypothetical protein